MGLYTNKVLKCQHGTLHKQAQDKNLNANMGLETSRLILEGGYFSPRQSHLHNSSASFEHSRFEGTGSWELARNSIQFCRFRINHSLENWVLAGTTPLAASFLWGLATSSKRCPSFFRLKHFRFLSEAGGVAEVFPSDSRLRPFCSDHWNSSRGCDSSHSFYPPISNLESLQSRRLSINFNIASERQVHY